MPFLLRSKNALDSEATKFNPESIFAWNLQPIESLAPASSWEEVAENELETILTTAPTIHQE